MMIDQIFTGCFHAGIGQEDLNNILTTVNMTEFSNSMWRARMEEIEIPVSKVATKTMQDGWMKKGRRVKI